MRTRWMVCVAFSILVGTQVAFAAQIRDGVISGTVVDARGQPLTGQRIELERPRSEDAGGEGRFVATTDGAGFFAFRQLGPGQYEVQYHTDVDVVVARRAIELNEKSMQVTGVILVRPAPARAREDLPVAHNQALTANPFLIAMLKWFNLEYEHKARPNTTWGLSGSLSEFEGFRYRSAKAFWRYYPGGHALSGLFIGGRSGVYSVGDGGGADPFFAVGVEVGRTRFYGEDQRWATDVSVGVARLFGQGEDEGPLRTVPTLRLNVGVGF